MYWNMFDLVRILQYVFITQETEGQHMNFLEAIFSVVFGDGDPNKEFDDKRWNLIGQYIQVTEACKVWDCVINIFQGCLLWC